MPTARTPPLTPTLDPPAPPQPPGMLGNIMGGIQSRNLLPALAIGGLIGLLPPLLYGKRSRGGAARQWGALGMQLGMNELNRPEREAQQKQEALGKILTTGLAGPTGPPGASSLGKFGGVDLYQTPTIGEMFGGGVPPPPSGLSETDLGTRATPMGGSLPPEPPMSDAKRAIMSLQATPDNVRVLAQYEQNREAAAERNALGMAKLQQTADLAAQEGQRYEATNRMVEANVPEGYDVVPGVGPDGRLVKKVVQKRGAGSSKQNEREYRVDLENQRLGYKMNPAQESQFVQGLKKEGRDTLGDFALKQQQRDVQQQAQEWHEKVLTKLEEVGLPAEFDTYTETPTLWEGLRKDPNFMAIIGEEEHAQIGRLIRERYKAQIAEREFSAAHLSPVGGAAPAPGGTSAMHQTRASGNMDALINHLLLKKKGGQ